MNKVLLLTQSQPGVLKEHAWLPKLLTVIAAGIIGVLVAVVTLREPLLSLGLLALPLFALMVRYPRQAFYLYVFLYPLIANLRRDVSPIPALRINEALILAFFVAIVLHGLLHWPWRVSFGLMDLALLFWLFSGSIIPSIVAYGRGQVFTSETINELIGFTKYFLIYRIARAVIQKREHVVHVIVLFLASSVVVALLAIAQKPDLFGIRDILHSYYLTDSEQLYMANIWRDEDLYRVTSTTSSYNVLGGYLTITLIIGIFFTQAFSGLKSLLWLVPVIAVDSVAFILTGNTSGMFGLLTAIIIGTIILRRIPRALPPLLIGVVVASIFFSSFIMLRLNEQFNTSGEDGDRSLVGRSLIGRISLWREEMLPALEDKYVLGIGPELPDEVWQTTEESQYLYLLFKGGALYLVSYFIWSGLVIALGISVWRSPDPLLRMLGLIGALIAIALLYMGIGNAYITFTSLMTSVWIVLAMISTASRWAEREPQATNRGFYV